jgi:two-component system, sensor histidine kinase
VVGNGRDALQKISDDQPDLVITDLFMPEMSGDDMIAALRKKGCDVPIIGLTAAAVGDDIHRLEQAGATAVMIKPLDISAIRDVIDDIAARTRKRPPRSKAKA